MIVHLLLFKADRFVLDVLADGNVTLCSSFVEVSMAMWALDVWVQRASVHQTWLLCSSHVARAWQISLIVVIKHHLAIGALEWSLLRCLSYIFGLMNASSSQVLRNSSHVALTIELALVLLVENDLLVRITNHGWICITQLAHVHHLLS